MRRLGVYAIVTACLALSGRPLAAQSRPGASAEEIARLVKLLGSDRFAEREAATVKLAEIGGAALAAVRQAISAPDLEVSVRARLVYRLVTHPDPNEVRARRMEIQSAFQRGAYEEMARLCGEMVAKQGDVLDRLWLGHAHQLAGQWPQAVAAYRGLADWLTEELKELAKEPPAPLPGDDPPLSAEERADRSAAFRQHRAGLMWLVGRLQEHELKDPAAACATFAEGEKQIADASPTTPLGQFRFVLLRGLARCQEARSQREEALATWGRIYDLGTKCRHWPEAHEAGFDVDAVIRLVERLPAGKPLPRTPGVIVLSADKPKVELPLDEDKTWLLSYKPLGARLSPAWWHMAFVPPPGMEIEAIKLDADFEQLMTTGPRAHIYCKARPRGKPDPEALFSGVTWPEANQAGRRTVSRSFATPEGTGPIIISTATSKEHIVHRITAEANLVPQRKAGKAFRAAPAMRVELLPPGGTLTCDGNKTSVSPNVIHTRFAVGRHTFEYLPPGGVGVARKLAADVDLVVGGTHALFLNAASLFRPQPTNLRSLGDPQWWMASSTTLAQLPDGRWLLAKSGRDEKVTLVESNDLLSWGEGRPLASSAAFRNHSPRLFVDDKGVIWLAWFSDCLQVETPSWHSQYRLWIASSRDGREWSRPRPIVTDSVGDQWPPDPACLLRDAKGKYWVFWRNLAACADSLDGIAELKPIERREISLAARNTHVAVDPAGVLHMLFDKDLGIAYSRSADGKTWDAPTMVVAKPRAECAWRGQLVFGKDGTKMLYEHGNTGAFLCSVSPGDSPVLGSPVKITGGQAPLNSMRLCWAKDGRAVILAGADTACLLQAPPDDFWRAGDSASPK